MRKLFLSILFVLTMTTGVVAQQIQNIRAVASGDTILISYDLVSGLANQPYKISSTCWDGLATTELKSIQGLTVVKPGRNLQFKWRVLDDMEFGLVGDSIRFTLVAREYEPPVADGFDKSLTIEDRKAALITDLTSQITTYLNEVQNQATLMRDYSQGVFAGRSAMVNLNEQRKVLNAAYNTLIKNRRTFELDIYSLWKDKAKAAADIFFTNTLDGMHNVYVLQLNDDVMKRMNDYNDYGGKHYKDKQLLTDIERDTKDLTTHLLKQELINAHKLADDLYDVLKL